MKKICLGSQVLCRLRIQMTKDSLWVRVYYSEMIVLKIDLSLKKVLFYFIILMEEMNF